MSVLEREMFHWDLGCASSALGRLLRDHHDKFGPVKAGELNDLHCFLLRVQREEMGA
jgi:hypothetical protein